MSYRIVLTNVRRTGPNTVQAEGEGLVTFDGKSHHLKGVLVTIALRGQADDDAADQPERATRLDPRTKGRL